jgi:hypothetical protein
MIFPSRSGIKYINRKEMLEIYLISRLSKKMLKILDRQILQANLTLVTAISFSYNLIFA